MSRFDWDNLYKEYYKKEDILFETIDQIKDDPIEDNKDLPIYSGGHYS
jgi:hypothetical protein